MIFHNRLSQASARASAVFAFTLFFIASASASSWVRVHGDIDQAEFDTLRTSGQLMDYGTQLFGELDADSIARLRDAGLRVSELDNPFSLTLGGETFDPLARATPAGLRQSDSKGDFHLIQFQGPIRPEWLNRLRAEGVEVVQPLHPFSYIVWASADQLDRARSQTAVRWSGQMEANWKVQPHQRRYDAAPRATMMLASAHGDVHERIAALRELGPVQAVTPLGRHLLVIQMDLAGNLYSQVADWPGIYAVQYVPPEAGPRGEMSNQSVVGNYDAENIVFPGYASWLSDTGFDGSGITVGVVDGRVRTTHVDLADRMVPCTGTNGSCTTSGTSGHGTHVAGAIAGTGASGTLLNGFLRGQGVAPGVNLVTQEYGPFVGPGPGSMVADGMLKIYQDSARSGSLLTNNSWGPTGSPQGYDIPTQQIDFITRDADPDTPGDQPVLPVWSIMNGSGDSGGACAPSSLGSPDEAKNLFAVGSTSLQNTDGSQVSNIFRISSNSGHGNACDGRRRPDIVAPGCYTDSTVNSSDTAHATAPYCGTSMASPVVSGSVSVWAQKYIDQTGSNPSPALVKAVFTAAARDLVGNPNADGTTMGHRPDRFQGYGRLDLDLVMNHDLEVFMVDQDTVFTSTGDNWSIGLNAVDPAEPIRIMLAWTDAPGAGLAGTTPAWVNNLDLAVETDGNTFLGNVIGGDGWSATGGSADDRNNLEGVFLSPAQHGGAVSITVLATDIAGDALNPYDPGAPSQDFALACYNCIIGDPTFTLAVNPAPLEACTQSRAVIFRDRFDLAYSAPDPTVALNVNVGTLGPYSGTVDLSSSGEPAGVTSAFSPAAVDVPGSSTLTLTIAEGAPQGSGTISLSGDDGSDQNSIELAYQLDAPLEEAPNPTGPPNSSNDLGLQPEFTWAALAGVSDYVIEIATDSGFFDTVIITTVTATSFTPDFELDTGTEYFWRVAGSNSCGSGIWSDSQSLITQFEPIASFSATGFDMSVSQNGTTSEALQISNVGTGNLVWSIASDQIESPGSRGGIDPSLDEPLDVGSFSVTGNASGGNIESLTIPAGLLTRGTVLGFEFQGSVSGITGNQDWASDLRMIITSPSGASFNVGGFSSVVNAWDFQGGGSNNDGTYSSSHPAAFGPDGSDDQGDWTVTFQHGWANDSAGTMSWSDVTITLLKTPPPFCNEPITAVPWLSTSPDSGSVAAGNTDSVGLNVDASGLTPGIYTGYLCVESNDPTASLTAMPVELTVVSPP